MQRPAEGVKVDHLDGSYLSIAWPFVYVLAAGLLLSRSRSLQSKTPSIATTSSRGSACMGRAINRARSESLRMAPSDSGPRKNLRILRGRRRIAVRPH